MLNGNKMWITNGPDADTFVIYAKTDPAAGPKGISAFIVEAGTPVSPPPRSSTSSACAAPAPASWYLTTAGPQENLLGPLHGGVKVLMSGLDYERVVLAAGPWHHAGLHGRGAALCARAQAVWPAHR